MQLPKPLQNLLDQARKTSKYRKQRVIQLKATLITPSMHIELILPSGFAKLSDFSENHSDDAQIKAQLQPGVYQDKVLPYKDDLFIEVIEREGLTQTVTKYRAVPLGDANPSMGGNHTALANMSALDNKNIITVQFQLMDPGFAKLRNKLADRIVLMGKLDDTLHNLLTEAGNKLGLIGPNAFRGVTIEKPIDNLQVFETILIPQGTKLIKLAKFLQNDDHYGFYSKGLGCYYRKGMWYIYPLYKLGRYKKATKVLDVYRLPEDVAPSLEASYYTNDQAITVLSTGPGQHTDGADITKQNVGTGARVINPDAVAGEVGAHYGKGKLMTTRQDSLSEFRTSERAGDNDIVPFHAKPSANIWSVMSNNAVNDGTRVVLEWRNSEAALVTPGMPCRYYYMEGESLKIREGTVLGIKMELQRDSQSVGGSFRESAMLELFLIKEEIIE